MKFCPKCDNILFPHKKKLYCKACNLEFDLDIDQKDEYKIVKVIKHDEMDSAPIIIRKNLKSGKISEEDRKAYEEFFTEGETSED